MTQEKLPDLIPLDELIENLDFKLEINCCTGILTDLQLKEMTSLLVYLRRYRDSIKRKTRKKK